MWVIQAEHLKKYQLWPRSTRKIEALFICKWFFESHSVC